MFDDLWESRPCRDRSTGQMIGSIIVHIVIVAVSIRLTRAVAESIAKPPIEMTMQLTRTPVPRVSQAVSAPSPAGIPAMASLPVVAPVDIPTNLPPPAVGRGFDATRLDRPAWNGGSPGLRDSAASDLQTAVTMLDADEPAQYLDGPRPVYPPALRQVGGEGSVHLRYIVGIDGRAEPGSIQALQSTNTAFEAPAVDAIARARFRPARLQGRVVRELVEQIVRFTVR